MHDLETFARRLEASFLGRCARSFVEQQGIDRAMAIASQAFTALIPLFILVSALSPVRSRDIVSDAIIRRFALGGNAADAVKELFARPDDAATGVLSVVLLVFSGISLARRLQRMYLQAWRLEPRAGVRGSLSATLGLAALLLEVALLYFANTLVRALPFGWGLGLPVSALASLVLWTSVPWLLLDRRIHWRRLVPAGVLTATCASAFGVASTIYMPSLMETYSVRYGLFGVTLALVGWLLCIALIVVTATVVTSELDRSPDPWARRFRVRFGLEPAADGTPTPITDE